ncbi:hypothetical protein KM043_007089 [Ampulex compressa]|nr:hypothetical protein KM043_007089 [Ampulex compressa]
MVGQNGSERIEGSVLKQKKKDANKSGSKADRAKSIEESWNRRVDGPNTGNELRRVANRGLGYEETGIFQYKSNCATNVPSRFLATGVVKEDPGHSQNVLPGRPYFVKASLVARSRPSLSVDASSRAELVQKRPSSYPNPPLSELSPVRWVLTRGIVDGGKRGEGVAAGRGLGERVEATGGGWRAGDGHKTVRNVGSAGSNFRWLLCPFKNVSCEGSWRRVGQEPTGWPRCGVLRMYVRVALLDWRIPRRKEI